MSELKLCCFVLRLEVITSETIILLKFVRSTYVDNIKNIHKPMHFWLGAKLKHAEPPVWSLDAAVRWTSLWLSPICEWNGFFFYGEVENVVSLYWFCMLGWMRGGELLWELTYLLHVTPLAARRFRIEVQRILIDFTAVGVVHLRLAEKWWIVWLCGCLRTVEDEIPFSDLSWKLKF